MSALLDSNQRLRRELRVQKLSSTRRWLWGGLALLICTLGVDVLRTAFVALYWTLDHPSEAWPLLVSNISLWSLWLVYAFLPLTLALFGHSVLNSYSFGRSTLPRTVGKLGMGLAMQIPLLYFAVQLAVHGLAQLQTNPFFEQKGENAWANSGQWMKRQQWPAIACTALRAHIRSAACSLSLCSSCDGRCVGLPGAAGLHTHRAALLHPLRRGNLLPPLALIPLSLRCRGRVAAKRTFLASVFLFSFSHSPLPLHTLSLSLSLSLSLFFLKACSFFWNR